MNNNQRIQRNIIIVNLLHLKRYLPDKADQFAESLLDNLIDLVNDFINDPEKSDVNLPWVTSLINFYSNVGCFEVSNAFFQRIELAKLVKFYRAASLSYLVVFLQHFVCYLSLCEEHGEDIEKRKKMIKDVFLEIDLNNYVNSVNDNLQERLNIASKPGYTSDSKETMSSTISNIANYYYRASNLSNDDEVRLEIRSRVGEFYTKIDFELLGKMLEIQKKELGPVTRMINVMRKSGCDKALVEKMLYEIDFLRLANAYNDRPVSSCTQIGSFCKAYFYTKSLHKKWNEFFETIDFSKCFMKGGFNFLDNMLVLQILRDSFKKNTNALSKVLSYFDFEQVGLKARGKKSYPLNQLFRHLLSVNLTQRQYHQFIDAFGVEECRRHADDRDLLKILKICNYSNENLNNSGSTRIRREKN